MLLEKLLKEIKINIEDVKIKDLNINLSSFSINKIYKFFKNKDGIYKDGDGEYYFKIPINTKNNFPGSYGSISDYGFVVIFCSINDRSDEVHNIEYETVPESGQVGKDLLNYGNPIKTLKIIANILNKHSEENPNAVYFYYADRYRKKLYKNLLSSLSGKVYKSIKADDLLKNNRVYFSKNKDALSKVVKGIKGMEIT